MRQSIVLLGGLAGIVLVFFTLVAFNWANGSPMESPYASSPQMNSGQEAVGGSTPKPPDEPAPASTPTTDPGPIIIDESAPVPTEPAQLTPTAEPESIPTIEPTPDGVEIVDVELASHLTGPLSPARTDEQWNVRGSDLGFTFEHDGTLYMVFGDTWGRDGVEGDDWRSNIMTIVEPDPEHGYVITDAITDEHGDAKELLPSLKVPGEEYTIIPNAGVAVGDRMYLHYISIRDWIQHWWGYKEPIVNRSGIAYSDDGGHTWIMDETAVWDGDTPFAEAAMVPHDGYVYVFGTPGGRLGPVQLLRTPEDELLNPEAYEYWTGDDWEPDQWQAVEIVPPPVGELSVRWSERHQRWLMMYKNEDTHNIVLRVAEELQGPWDEERIVATAEEYPKLYAPLMLPIEDDEVYFTMSVFLPEYQVYLMRMTLN